jgi:hypothetical protein
VLESAAVPFLEKLCQETGGRMFSLKSTRSLDDDFAAIFDEFPSRYVVSYVPTGVAAKAGWHGLSVRVKRRGAKVVGRRGYMAGPGGTRFLAARCPATQATLGLTEHAHLL